MKDSLTVILITFSIAAVFAILYFATLYLVRRRERNSILKMLEQNRSSIHVSRKVKKEENSKYALNDDDEVPQRSEILRMLRENSTESRRLAVSNIKKYKIVSLAGELCNCLTIPVLEAEASLVLEEFGESCVGELINFCNRSKGNVAAGKSALRLLGKADNRESSLFLFTKLWDESREVREEAAKALAGSDFFISAGERSRFNALIEDVSDCMAWDIEACSVLLKNNDQFLLDAIECDIKRWQEFLFMLLSIAYGRGRVELIRHQLANSGRDGSIAGKLIYTMMDQNVRDKVKLVLIPMPEKVRLKKLWKHYPVWNQTYDELVEGIINRDYNQIDLWIKACTLRRLTEIRTPGIQESVSALLFSHEEIMREESARLMARANRDLYWSVSERIADPFRRRLDRIVMGTIEKEELLYEKVIFLSGKFKSIPRYELMNLAAGLVYAHEFGAAPGENCIIWPLNGNGSVHCILYKSADAGSDIKLPGMEEPCYFLSMSSLEEFRIQYPDHSEEINLQMLNE